MDPIEFVGRARWPVAGLALALLAAALLAWQGGLALRDAQALQTRRDALAAQRRQLTVRPQASPAEAKRHAEMDVLLQHLAAPWAPLLGLLEGPAAPGVVLTRLESDALSGRIELTGRARGADALGGYLLALEGDPRLSGVLLRRHEVLRDEPGAPIEFSLSAGWGGAPGVSAPRTEPQP